MVTQYPTYVLGVPGPREVMFTQSDKDKLDNLSGGALLPPGGNPSNVLIKVSATDYDVRWANVQAFNGTLSALGQPAGYAPVAQGDDTWEWAEVDLNPVVDWVDILNKPPFGTASESNVEDFASASHTHDGGAIVSGTVPAAYLPRLTELEGVTISTSEPAGGVDGDVHLQYIA